MGFRKWEQHLRHSRGYGVHSPFLYGVVRDSMMPRKVMGDNALYNELRSRGIDKRTAIRLQNYLHHEGFTRWSIGPEEELSSQLCILPEECPEEMVSQMHQELCHHAERATLCLLHSTKSRKRMRDRIVTDHPCMSAEKSRFTLLFLNPSLPKQHIVI